MAKFFYLYMVQFITTTFRFLPWTIVCVDKKVRIQSLMTFVPGYREQLVFLVQIFPPMDAPVTNDQYQN